MTRASRIVSLAVVISMILVGAMGMGYARLASAESAATPNARATQTAAAAAVRTIEAALAATPTVEPSSTPTPTPQSTQAAPGPSLALSPTVESQHPYANNTDESWLISSLDAGAEATSLHFSHLELEEGVDWLIIMDAQDVEIQRLTGDYPDGVWTDPVPGNLLKIQLITDGSVQRWGFVADATASVPFTSLAYSPHPYPNNADLKWTFNNLDANASGTRLHFSRIALEENVDWLVIMDITETPYQWITGQYPDGLWTNGIPETGVIVRLISDTSVRDWGFNIDKLESSDPSEIQPRTESNKTLAESKHPYESNTVSSWTLVNPNPSAAFTKLHFTRLDMGGEGDALVLSDGNGNRIQTFGENTHLLDFWSDDIPGRVVKLQLSAGRYYEDWGMRIDQLANGESRAALAESPHFHPANWSYTWTLVNPNPAAAFSKLHFTRLHTGGEGDSLILSDGNGNRVQTFGENTAQLDFWSDDIPGRVVKIQLNAGRYYEGWGVRIDNIVDGESRAALAESPHFYPASWSNTWNLVNPNPAAAFSKVHFTRLDIGGEGDSLVLYDGSGNQIQVFGENTHQRDFWSDEIPGRVVKITLKSGRYYEDWGFRIDDIAPKAEETPVPAFVSAVYVYVGQPGTLALNEVVLGKVTEPGDYLIRLPGIGEHAITVESLFTRQTIVVSTDKKGNVEVAYQAIEAKE